MWKSIAGWVSHQVRSERNKLLAAGGLPFFELLPAACVERVLADEHVQWRECVYSPLVTLWAFLSQTLCADHSCRQAVARLRAFLTADGKRPCGAQTGPYCKARQRLPENVCARLARDVGEALHQRIEDRGLLTGRPIKLVDGTTVSMPDTATNQAAYPQSRSQKPGLGFPIVRWWCCCHWPAARCWTWRWVDMPARTREKRRCSANCGVRCFPATWWWETAISRPIGIWRCWRCAASTVSTGNITCGSAMLACRLGPGDWLLRLPKPQRPRWIDRASYRRIPRELLVREVRFRVRVRGWRVRQLTLVTTLCDAERYRVEELARVYHGTGKRKSIYVQSRSRCKWTCCVARRPRWCARRSGCTFWPII